jgi:integrase
MDTFKRFLVIGGLAEVTVKGHMKAVERIGKKIGTLHPTIEEAKNFIADLYMSEYSYSHKSNQAKALEYWMQHTGRPIIFGRQRKPRPLLKNTLTESEITRLVISTRNAKERAILLLLAYSGLRPKELCAVKIENINFGSLD